MAVMPNEDGSIVSRGAPVKRRERLLGTAARIVHIVMCQTVIQRPAITIKMPLHFRAARRIGEQQ
jgi:hypothetical protein